MARATQIVEMVEMVEMWTVGKMLNVSADYWCCGCRCRCRCIAGVLVQVQALV
jgi:hypothetical protein